LSEKKIVELVYYSISNTEQTSESMSNILAPSREFNSKNNITGCLLFHNKIFLQLLEGEKEAVQSLYKKIKNDNRHSNVTLIAEEDAKERMFPGWSMAFHELSSSDKNVNQFIKNIDFYSENSDKQTNAIDMFWSMAKQIVVK
jgi:predicted sulfurtransferase